MKTSAGKQSNLLSKPHFLKFTLCLFVLLLLLLIHNRQLFWRLQDNL